MPKFAVLGDAHLWPVLWQRMPEARNDAFVAAAQVFQYAKDAKLPVISSGDILNFGQKGGVATCLNFLQRWLPRLKEFRYVVGNHDLTGYTSGLVNDQWVESLSQTEATPEVRHLTTTASDDAAVCGGVLKVAGIDYCHGRTSFLERLAEVREGPMPDVLVIHQGLREILGFEGAWEVECAELDGVAKVVLCGHTHVSWHRQLDNTLVISPGSTIPWQFDEEHDKTFPVVEVSDTGATVEWVEIKQRRPIIVATATDAEQRQKILTEVREYQFDETLPEEIRRPILRLRYIAEEKFHEELTVAAEDRMILDLTADRIQLTGKLNLGALEDRPEDVDDVVVATHKHTSPGRVREAALEVQRMKDPEGVVDKHIQELLGETSG